MRENCPANVSLVVSQIVLSNLKLERPLAVLDLESTGFDPVCDRIVEAAILRIDPSGESELFHKFLKPCMPIPPAATRVHGITDADVRDSPMFAEIASELRVFLAGADLAGFGIARFDLPLLIVEFTRASIEFSTDGRSVVDALDLYRMHEPRNLASAVRLYLGREHCAAHSAIADALAALSVLDAQIGRYALPTDPKSLHAISRQGAVGSTKIPDSKSSPSEIS